jgi:hypothetical protein
VTADTPAEAEEEAEVEAEVEAEEDTPAADATGSNSTEVNAASTTTISGAFTTMAVLVATGMAL